MGDEALYICALTGTTLLRQPSAMDGWHPPDSLLGIKLSFEQAENLFPDVEGIMLGEGRTSEQELITRFAELGKDGIPA